MYVIGSEYKNKNFYLSRSDLEEDLTTMKFLVVVYFYQYPKRKFCI